MLLTFTINFKFSDQLKKYHILFFSRVGSPHPTFQPTTIAFEKYKTMSLCLQCYGTLLKLLCLFNQSLGLRNLCNVTLNSYSQAHLEKGRDETLQTIQSTDLRNPGKVQETLMVWHKFSKFGVNQSVIQQSCTPPWMGFQYFSRKKSKRLLLSRHSLLKAFMSVCASNGICDKS